MYNCILPKMDNTESGQQIMEKGRYHRDNMTLLLLEMQAYIILRKNETCLTNGVCYKNGTIVLSKSMATPA